MEPSTVHMNNYAARVTAEWAIKSKEPHDTEYRLLDASRGALSRDNFDRALERYSPGTPQDLPQVTINWLPDSATGRTYVGLAIYKRPDVVVYDAASREFVRISYFCVDFDELAPTALSYYSMYKGFRELALPSANGSPIVRELPIVQPETLPRPLALQAAALLLTDQNVCILGADHVSLDGRLRFIDEVVSLLPYGMRARLSTSTWVSSTYTTHKIRLFFARSQRGSEHDFVLDWSKDYSWSREYYVVNCYLDWLRMDIPGRIALLSQDKAQIGFSWSQVEPMLVRYGVIPTQQQQLLVPAEPEKGPAVEDMLKSCASLLDSAQPDRAWDNVQWLRRKIGQTTEAERQSFQQIIKENRLLREDVRSKSLRSALYEVLLRLAFSDPLSYEAYCAVEECVGERDGCPIHPPLAAALDKLRPSNLTVELLVLNAIGSHALQESLRRKPIAPGPLISMAASSSIDERHGQIVCGIALDYLEERSGYFDKSVLMAAFQPYSYLGSAMRRVYNGDPEEQRRQLIRVLRIVYGQQIDQEAITDVLDSPIRAPSRALWAAVLSEIGATDTEHAVWSLASGLVKGGGFDDEQFLLGRLHENHATQPPAADLKSWESIQTWLRTRTGSDVILAVLAIVVCALILYLAIKMR
jgi:hypothetical protein